MADPQGWSLVQPANAAPPAANGWTLVQPAKPGTARTPDRPKGPATIGEQLEEKRRRVQEGIAAFDQERQSGDAVKGFLANAAKTVYGGGDLIRRATGMERVIDRPAVQAAMAVPNTPAGQSGAAAETLAEVAVPTVRTWTAARSALPTTMKAGAKFAEVMGAAKDVPIDISGPGNVALRIQELAERGGQMPKAVRDILKRFTDPGKATPTYEEMRDFYSNISRLSGNEYQRLTPVMVREIGNLRVALNSALEKAAAVVDKKAVYQSAMREYRQAAKLKDAVGAVKDAAVKYAVPGGLAYYGIRKFGDLIGGVMGSGR